VTDPAQPTKWVAVLAPMRPELRAVVHAGALKPLPQGAPFSHGGTAGSWTVRAGLIGVGPTSARQATERMLASGSFDHVMLVGIAGGIDAALPMGALMVPSHVSLYPDGPRYRADPLASRQAAGCLLTTDGLLSAEGEWRAILEAGFGAVDMEAAGVAEVCARAGVGWSVYRGISDRPEESVVDQSIFALSKANGSPDLVAVSKYVARDPRRIITLARLGRSMGYASRLAATAAFADLIQN
jgi:nucleoside phosphorylase